VWLREVLGEFPLKGVLKGPTKKRVSNLGGDFGAFGWVCVKPLLGDKNF